jgi:hypothetical protein
MATNPDFRDLLSALCAEGADFIIVGLQSAWSVPVLVTIP